MLDYIRLPASKVGTFMTSVCLQELLFHLKQTVGG